MWLKRSFITSAIASALLLVPVVSSGQQSGADQPPAASSNTKQMESMLVSRMHMVNQLEIKAGEMAANKGSEFDVRAYGQRLRLDHTLADAKVLAYAKANGLQVMSADELISKMQQMSSSIPQAEIKPEQMAHSGMSSTSETPPAQQLQQQMQEAQSTMQQLEGMEGKAFDEGFTRFMQQGHTQAIGMLSLMQQALPANSGLRSLIGKMEPILEQHYDIAAGLQIATVRRQNRELGDKLSAQMANTKGGR